MKKEKKMPRRPAKRNRYMDVLAAQEQLDEKLAAWMEALRANDLNEEERSMHELAQRMAGGSGNGRRKKRDPSIDSNVFEPVQSETSDLT